MPRREGGRRRERVPARGGGAVRRALHRRVGDGRAARDPQPRARHARRPPRRGDAAGAAQCRGEKVVVGVNAFQLEEEEPYDALYIDESVTVEQLEILNRVRATRDGRRVEETLQALRNAAAENETNTMPFILDAVRAYATVGEISDALRDVFGTYQEPALF